MVCSFGAIPKKNRKPFLKQCLKNPSMRYLWQYVFKQIYEINSKNTFYKHNFVIV